VNKFTLPTALFFQCGEKLRKRNRILGLKHIGNIFADGFLRTPPVEAFGGPVPVGNPMCSIADQRSVADKIEQLCLRSDLGETVLQSLAFFVFERFRFGDRALRVF
jgi:hypothetical protein